MKIPKRYKEIYPGCEIRRTKSHVFMRCSSMRGGRLDSGYYLDRVYRASVDIEPVRRAVKMGGNPTAHLTDMIYKYGDIIKRRK